MYPREALAEGLLDIIRPRLEEMVDAAVEQRMLAKTQPWMTTEEAAEYLRTTPKAIRARAARGKIPSHKDDAGRWLFHREELDASLR